jgi:GNAT superfamily N-acetyltransferase
MNELQPTTPTKEDLMSEPELTALAEKIEAEFMFQYLAGTPAPARSALGIATTRIGGGIVASMRDDVTRYWSKALGFGFDEAVTGALIAEVFDFYRANGDPSATIQLAPAVLPHDWDKIRTEHNLSPGQQIVKLACPIEDFTPGETKLRVEPVEPGSAYEWAATTLDTFGMPLEGLSEMLVATLDSPAFQPFAAWDGDTIVAAGNLFIQGDVGSLNAGATLPSHRGRGAQSALIAARGEAAAAAGCRWLVSETGAPTGDKPGASLSNMRRAGLRDLYVRQNWRWRADGGEGMA